MSTIGSSAESKASPPAALDVDALRRDFPILDQRVNDRPLVYLDNAATTQKPRAVIDAMNAYYERDNANVHRGVHTLSQRATLGYERAREKVRRFIGSAESRQIVFTRGTTEAINLVAQAYARPRLKQGDEILLTHMEHHSNIVPWQIVAQQTGATVRPIPVTDAGEVDLDAYQNMLSDRVKIVGMVHVSNALGTINPVKHMIERAKSVGAATVIDGAQATPHTTVNVCDLDCDFYAISAHKMYGPTGIGALYGKREHLEAMPPYQGGGEMIRSVSFDGTTFNDLPHKYEAGTPNIAGAIGFGAAVDYLNEVGLDSIAEYEAELLAYATRAVEDIPELTVIGTAGEKASILSFTIGDIHPHDIGTILDHEGVAIRTGHHCTQPLMDRFGIPATARASLAFYNTPQEIDALVTGIHKVLELFG